MLETKMYIIRPIIALVLGQRTPVWVSNVVIHPHNILCQVTDVP
jgi:hypothetical protein